MAATLKRILAKVESCGLEYFCFNAEISPHGPGTRRFVLGKHIELPKKIENMDKDHIAVDSFVLVKHKVVNILNNI